MTKVEFDEWLKEEFLLKTKSISKKKDESNKREISLEDFIDVASKLMDTAFNLGVASITVHNPDE